MKCEVYERFQKKAESGTFLVITEDNWTYIQQRWKYVSAQTRMWQWKLDSNLPGRLGQIGDWLNRAEEMLDNELMYTDDAHEENAKMVRGTLDEHKVMSLYSFLHDKLYKYMSVEVR